MNKKVYWLLGFIIVAAFSCWATTSSFILMMPSVLSDNEIVQSVGVFALVLVFFVLASYALKLVIDALNNDGTLSHPKSQLWGGIILLIFTWVIVSLPTNAHTFFYKLKIGDVVTEDLSVTKGYSRQLADREKIASDYFKIEENVLKEWEDFEKEVKSGATGSGFGQYAAIHIAKINTLLKQGGLDRMIPTPENTNKAKDSENTRLINYWKIQYLVPALESLKDKHRVNEALSNEVKDDVRYIVAMEDSIHKLILTNQISDASSEPIITQSAGVLKVAYSNIKKGSEFVDFNNDEEKELYTATNIDTKTTRFLNPYSVMYDFFTGKIPFSFTIWLLLSILIDVSGFIFFYKATLVSHKN